MSLGLRNLGPASEKMLADAGLHSCARLHQLGAVRAYCLVKLIHPKASLNLLWALEGALTDRDWKAVSREERTALLMALDDQLRRDDLMPGDRKGGSR
jgi:DNA transformation protein and related proteins